MSENVYEHKFARHEVKNNIELRADRDNAASCAFENLAWHTSRIGATGPQILSPSYWRFTFYKHMR